MGKNAAVEYGGEPAANRAERERRRKGAQSAAHSRARRFPTSLHTFTLYHFPRSAYTLPRRFLLTAFATRRRTERSESAAEPPAPRPGFAGGC